MFSWKFGWIGYLVSNFDIIVVTVDGRGTGYRGERSVSNSHRKNKAIFLNSFGAEWTTLCLLSTLPCEMLYERRVLFDIETLIHAVQIVDYFEKWLARAEYWGT